jgi:CBS domain-containing protein
VPTGEWAGRRVEEIMTPLGDDLVVRPGDRVLRALDKASRNGIGRLAVLDGSRLVGYVSLKDITHVLALRGVTGADRGVQPPAERAPLRRAA